eukprot:gene8776-1151_t
MDFSRALPCSGRQPPLFSPDGNLIAACIENKLVIRRSDDLASVGTHACKDAVKYMEWSSDSRFIITANFQRALIEVWSIDDPDWECRIDEGAAGTPN